MVEMCGWMHPTFHALARSKRHRISGIAITPYLFRNSVNITTMTTLPRCYISQSSVISVMSMFNFISTPLCCDQISQLRRALQANFRSHTAVRDIFDFNVKLHSPMTSVTSIFSCTLPFPPYYPISHLTHYSWHPWCYSISCEPSVVIKFPTSAVRCGQISDFIQLSVTSVIIMCNHTSSVTSMMSMFNFTFFKLLSNFRSHTVVGDICDIHV